MPHSPGFHKDEDAKERCWGCSHPEHLDFTEEHVKAAQQLIDDGWKQRSRKYRLVARVTLPPFHETVTVSENVPAWVREELKHSYEYLKDKMLSMRLDGVEHMEVEPAIFQAYLHLKSQKWLDVLAGKQKNTPHPEAPEPFDRGEPFDKG